MVPLVSNVNIHLIEHAANILVLANRGEGVEYGKLMSNNTLCYVPNAFRLPKCIQRDPFGGHIFVHTQTQIHLICIWGPECKMHL